MHLDCSNGASSQIQSVLREIKKEGNVIRVGYLDLLLGRSVEDVELWQN